MATSFVYALIDPNGWVRYVGQSTEPVRRLGNHLLAGSQLVQGWVRELAARGGAPRFVVLEQCARGLIDERELMWIARFADAGAPLLNQVDTPVMPRASSRTERLRPSTGSKLLSVACAKHGSIRKLSRDLGVANGVVNRWCSGKTRPVTKLRVELEKLLGIPWNAWEESAA